MAVESMRQLYLPLFHRLPHKSVWDRNNPRGYYMARREHAWLLRAEGKSFKEIGWHLNVSAVRARDLVFLFGQRVSRAMKRTRMKGCNMVLAKEGHVFVHTYRCDVCEQAYTESHKDAFLYDDPCPECGAWGNDPVDIQEAPCGTD